MILKLNKNIAAFCACESGATAIEYALMSGLLALAVIGSAKTLGDNLNFKFYALGSAVDNAGNLPPAGDS